MIKGNVKWKKDSIKILKIGCIKNSLYLKIPLYTTLFTNISCALFTNDNIKLEHLNEKHQ